MCAQAARARPFLRARREARGTCGCKYLGRIRFESPGVERRGVGSGRAWQRKAGAPGLESRRRGQGRGVVCAARISGGKSRLTCQFGGGKERGARGSVGARLVCPERWQRGFWAQRARRGRRLGPESCGPSAANCSARLGTSGSQWGRASLGEASLQLAALNGAPREKFVQFLPGSMGALLGALQNWPQNRWRGAVSWRDADATGVAWNRVAPALASLESAGRSDGSISFPALDGAAVRNAVSRAGRSSDARDLQVLARDLSRAASGARGEIQARGAVVQGVPVRMVAARWALGSGREAGTLRFASSVDAATIREALNAPGLRARLGRDAALIEAARGLASASGSLLDVRGSVDVARLAGGDWRRAGSFEASTPSLVLDAARLGPWLASERGRELGRSLSPARACKRGWRYQSAPFAALEAGRAR